MKYAEPIENSRKSLIKFVMNHPHHPNKHVHGSLFPKIKYLEKRVNISLSCRDIQKISMHLDAQKPLTLLLIIKAKIIKWFKSIRCHTQCFIFI